MSLSGFSRAAAAALLASGVLGFDAGSFRNIAMYWGQSANQVSLLRVCSDPTIDLVNLAFVDGFPTKRGGYPKSNFGNSCANASYPDPLVTTQPSGLLNSCPGVEDAINLCQRNGKRVLLSITGGYPVNGDLPTDDLSEYLAEFLIGAFGPRNPQWSSQGKPRPFGGAAVDGFNIHLDAADYALPNPAYKPLNYLKFSEKVRDIMPNLTISAAPQCTLPDAQLSDALSKSTFDILFLQFYNNPKCSARAGYNQRNQTQTDFTLSGWANWVQQNAASNPKLKLYLGLAASPDGASPDKNQYLMPDEAYTLAIKYQMEILSYFGGMMIWDATLSAQNLVKGQSYSYWMQAVLTGTFPDNYAQIPSSSIVVTSGGGQVTPPTPAPVPIP